MLTPKQPSMGQVVRNLPISVQKNHQIIVDGETEAELVSGMRRCDPKTFRLLYKKYSRALMGVLMDIIAQQETAEDLLQECFLKICRNFDGYDQTKGRLFTWMLNLTRNTAIDHLRLRSTKNAKITSDMNNSLQEIENASAYSFNPEVIGLKQLIASLSQKNQLIIDLIYFKGYTHSEAAEELEMPLGSVKTSIRLAINSLRNVFIELAESA